MQKELKCVKCGSKWVVNKTHKLCGKCNKERLNNQKSKNIGSYFSESTTKINDRSTYKKVFNKGNCQCENCGIDLPTEFEREGKVLNAWRYSHILTKAAYPEFRHDVRNFNDLCFDCHQKWEFGDRSSMVINERNKEIIETLINERNDKRNSC